MKCIYNRSNLLSVVFILSCGASHVLWSVFESLCFSVISFLMSFGQLRCVCMCSVKFRACLFMCVCLGVNEIVIVCVCVPYV